LDSCVRCSHLSIYYPHIPHIMLMVNTLRLLFCLRSWSVFGVVRLSSGSGSFLFRAVVPRVGASLACICSVNLIIRHRGRRIHDIRWPWRRSSSFGYSCASVVCAYCVDVPSSCARCIKSSFVAIVLGQSVSATVDFSSSWVFGGTTLPDIVHTVYLFSECLPHKLDATGQCTRTAHAPLDQSPNHCLVVHGNVFL